jgi:hypothetical protein
MEYATLAKLRKHHAGWKLLNADSAPFIASFLHRAFVRPNARSIRQDELEAQLEDYLHFLRDVEGADFPRTARKYLEDWANGEVAILRKYYPPGSDEPEFDLTPAAEKALEWLATLGPRAFVGTESRLLTIVQLLREIVTTTEASPETRIAELERRKDELEQEIARVRAGGYAPFNPTQIKERYLQVEDTARRLLSDFRQVEENFRLLDRATRERIATSSGSKGEVLDTVFGEQDAIAASDQGRSFQAFWSFIMSPDRQEELAELVERTLRLHDVAELAPDELLPRIQFSLLEAGEKVQRTRAQLVEQLRRYLDEKVWLENKRIVEIMRRLEQNAIAVAQAPPPDKDFTTLEDLQPTLALPFERSLLVPTQKARFDTAAIAVGDAAFQVDALFAQHHVDEAQLRAHVRTLLRDRPQVTLAEVIAARPLTQGLAELVAYWQLACKDRSALVDEAARQRIELAEGDRHRVVSLPLIVFVRGTAAREERP